MISEVIRPLPEPSVDVSPRIPVSAYTHTHLTHKSADCCTLLTLMTLPGDGLLTASLSVSPIGSSSSLSCPGETGRGAPVRRLPARCPVRCPRALARAMRACPRGATGMCDATQVVQVAQAVARDGSTQCWVRRPNRRSSTSPGAAASEALREETGRTGGRRARRRPAVRALR